LNTRSTLDELLQRRLTHPSESQQIDAEIRRIFARTCAVFILDMAGFSIKTGESGIIPVLATIYRMNQIALPIVTSHQGNLVKLEADNIFATFPTVDTAIAAGLDILRELSAAGIQAGIGVGYGEVLLIEDDELKDLYGSEMNFASKLGEDLARSGELLLTEAAFQNQQNRNGNWERLELPASGFRLIAYKLILHPSSC
jgi:adenylate cyclase